MNRFPLTLAKKYVFSGKNAIEVNVISWIAFVALGFVATCLLLILTVFSGLEKINLQFYSDINPDLKIFPAKGKVIPEPENVLKTVAGKSEVAQFCRVIEEKAFSSYRDRTHFINLKGVDENITQIFPLDTLVKIGDFLDFDLSDDLLIGTEVASRLSCFIDSEEPIRLYVPKPGKGIINNPDHAFDEVRGYSTGIFYINDKYEQSVFCPLSLTQKLLQLDSTQYYSLEIKTTPNTNILNLKNTLSKQLGDDYTVKTRQELDAAFLKMINTENLIIYLILVLILIIASFNLAGSVAILILDKRADSQTLWSMGLSSRRIQRVFFLTGMSISVYALILGLILGTFIAWLQQTFGILMISAYIPFPVSFRLKNYIITIVSVLAIGFIVSYIVSRNAKVKSVK